jgi:hypothetical protein
MRILGGTTLFKASSRLALWSMVLAGCGEGSDGLPREAVSGTVTLDGQPLAEGSIQMIPIAKDGRPGGAIIKEGKFSIPKADGLLPGQYNVIISSIDPASAPPPPSGPPGPVDPATLPKNLIPEEYNKRSKLTLEVKPGTPNTFPFDLKSK